MFGPFSQTPRAIPPYLFGITLPTKRAHSMPLTHYNNHLPFLILCFPLAYHHFQRPPQERNENPRWRVTNYFFNFPCTGLALYHYLYGEKAASVEFKHEESLICEALHAPATAQRLDVPNFQSVLPVGFVFIDYATDALVHFVTPHCSRLDCQQLILSDLRQRLVVMGYGKTYICRKNRVDGMVWHAWWQVMGADDVSEDGILTPGSTTDIGEEDSDDESIGSLDWKPFIQE